MKLLIFPLAAFIASVFAYWQPELLVGLKGWIIPLLMLVMLGMGLTLHWQDFKKVWGLKKVVLVGVALQFLIMPLTAYALAKGLALSNELLIGMVLVGVTAGGTASNVITFLAKGNVALSVSMTIISTLLAIILMPFLASMYIGTMVEVPKLDMFITLLQIIIVPVLVGMAIRVWLRKYIFWLSLFSAQFSMFAIVCIIAIVVALNSGNVANLALPLLLAVILHNLIGLLSGYWITKWMGYNSIIARTVGIEVGMQNSGLSVALALKFFTPLSALPGAIFSLWHNVSGIFFALYFSHKSKQIRNGNVQANTSSQTVQKSKKTNK